MSASILLYSGLDPQVVHIQGASGGSAGAYYVGDLVKSTSGELVIGTSKAYLGVAKDDFSTTDNVDTPVELIDSVSIYRGRLVIGTTGSEAYIGDELGFASFTPGAFTLSTGSTAELYCVGVHPDDGWISGGRVLFRFQYDCFVGTA